MLIFKTKNTVILNGMYVHQKIKEQHFNIFIYILSFYFELTRIMLGANHLFLENMGFCSVRGSNWNGRKDPSSQGLVKFLFPSLSYSCIRVNYRTHFASLTAFAIIQPSKALVWYFILLLLAHTITSVPGNNQNTRFN